MEIGWLVAKILKNLGKEVETFLISSSITELQKKKKLLSGFIFISKFY